MRHATVVAIQRLIGSYDGKDHWDHQLADWLGIDRREPNVWGVACDWTRPSSNIGDDVFWLVDAILLIGGKPCVLPDCPTCAAFIDLALSIRAEESQERINAELDAERRKTA